MPKTKISEYSATANSNTDVASINIDEGCAPSGINNAIRAVMGHLKDFQSGTSNDPFTVGSSGSLTLSYGTANGVAYLNGSKVLTTGSALTFDGSRLAIGTATSNIQLTTTVNTNQAYISLADADGRTAVFRGPNSGSPNCAQIGTTTNHETSFLYGGAEAMRLTSTSLYTASTINVGIGTSSPNILSWNKAVTLNTTSGNAGYELAIGGVAQAYFAADSTNVYLSAYANKPLLIRTNNSTVATFDTSGNLGLGVTPSAWYATNTKALQVGASSALNDYSASGNRQTTVSNNAYLNTSAAWTYSNTDSASRYHQTGGQHQWYIAPSGTKDTAISFRTSLTLSGNISGSNVYPSLQVNSGTATELSTAKIQTIKQDNNTTTSNIFVQFLINDGANGCGQITANGANTAAFGSYSDERLKENVVDLEPQLANIMSLRAVEFDYIESEGGGHQVGFIAQNMEQIYPDVVGEREDGMKMIAGWSKTEARLVKAIQEQQAIIQSLTARITALESA